jgi:diguanylate cyclase (GGDEF)-like protein
MPLKVGDIVVGVMNLSRMTAGGFSPSELRLLSLLSDQAAVAISNASLHQMISRQAYSDTLTGLPNRRALDERLEEEVLAARRNNYSFAVIMMDLDGFKDVNDTYGHSTGDDVLRVVFNQMARGVRNTDFLARYGGDELTLILSQTEMSSAQVVSEKILEGMRNVKYKLPDGRGSNWASPAALPSTPSTPATDRTCCGPPTPPYTRQKNITAARFRSHAALRVRWHPTG